MTIPMTSIEGIGLGPVSDTAALPPIDGLFAQNVQTTAGFQTAVEQFQLAMEDGLPASSAETPMTGVPVTGAPVTETSVTETSETGVPVTEAPVAKVPTEGAPILGATELPPLDDLLVQNDRATAAFAETAAKFQLAMKDLPLPKVGVPVAEAPVTGVPVAEVPVAGVPVAEVPVAGVPVTEAPVAKVPAEGAPILDATAFPPLDGLLAQNVRAKAGFQTAVEQFKLAKEGLPLSAAGVSAAEAPMTGVPVTGVQVAEVPVTVASVAKVPAEGAPILDAAELPPLDDLLVQNDRAVAAFAETAEKLQHVMKGLPLPKVEDPEDAADGADVAAPQALPTVEVSLPVRTELVAAADGAGAIRGVEAVRPVEAVGSRELIVIAEAVADRIMVSPGLMQGDGEVRVLLKPDVLQGTEIRVVSESGALNVNFIPATPEIAALLERNQPMLVQHLATHVPSVRLGVSVGRGFRNRENA